MRFVDKVAKASMMRAKRLKEAGGCLTLPNDEPRDFAKALLADGVSIIAELKRASPTLGKIRSADPKATACEYELGGASAISVLTEPEYFAGSIDDVRDVKDAVSLPVLRKDFLVDEIQVNQAAAYGADAVLLIVAVLGDGTADFIDAAHDLGLQALVEVHDEDELEIAVSCGAKIIGVNNRDLASLVIDLATCEKLIPKIPTGIVKVAESGINGHIDVGRMEDSGADAVLVGGALMQTEDIKEKLQELKCKR